MTMTSAQRVAAALAHREPDRTPVFEYVLLSPVADQLLGRTYGGDPAHWDGLVAELGWEGAVRRNARDRVELAALLGHDMMYVYPPSSAVLDEAVQPQASQPSGPVEAIRQRNARNATLAPPTERELLIYACVKEELAARGLDLPVLAPAYLHGVWTDVDLMQTMLLAPDVAHEHFRLATRRAMQLVDAYAQLGLEQAGVGGDFAGTKLIISPTSYRTFIVPEVRRVTDRVHKHGMVAVNASDGNLWAVLDDFLIGTGVDAYLEIDMHAGMDMARLKAAYGQRITLYGNLDCGNILSFGSVEEVRQHVIDCLEAGWGDGGHVLCASNAIAASVPLRNYMAVIGAYRDYFSLPPLAL